MLKGSYSFVKVWQKYLKYTAQQQPYIRSLEYMCMSMHVKLCIQLKSICLVHILLHMISFKEDKHKGEKLTESKALYEKENHQLR